MSHITMDQELAQACADAASATVSINAAITKLRQLRVSTSLREHDGRYYLDARAPLCRAVAAAPPVNET